MTDTPTTDEERPSDEPTELTVVLRPWLAERLTKLRAELNVVRTAHACFDAIKRDDIVQPYGHSADRSANRSYEDVKRSLTEKSRQIEAQIGDILTEGLHAASQS